MINFNTTNAFNSMMGTIGGLQQAKQNTMNLDAQMQQQQTAAQQQEQQRMVAARTQELMPLVKSGDYDATIELSTINPQISEAVTKAKASMKEGQEAEIANWLAGYHTAPDKEAYIAQDNPNVDIDDNFRGMDSEQRDSLTRIVGAQVMPKEMFNATFGGEQKAPSYSNVQFDEEGNPFGLNKSTGKYEPIQGGFVKGKAEPSTVVNVGKGETEQAKTIAKAEGENYNSYVKDAASARQNDNTLNRLDKLNEVAFSGIAAPAYKVAARLGDAIGIETEGLTETELFDSLSNQLVLGQTSKLTGVLTDKDMDLLASTVPQLSQTKEGRKQLISIMKEINGATKDKARLAAKFRKENDGQFDDMAFQEWLSEQPKEDRIAKIIESKPQAAAINWSDM